MGGMKGFIAGNYIGVYHPLIIVLSNTLRRRNNTTMPRCKEYLKISATEVHPGPPVPSRRESAK